MSRGALEAGAQALGVTATPLQIDLLLAYGALILKWNKVYNLTALREPDAVLTHHLLDSLAIVRPLAREFPGAGRLLDVGAGAGLPGAVIAIMRPDIDVQCVDAVAKKAAFVQQVSAELKLGNLRGVHARVEALDAQYDVVTSRAFASLTDFVRGSQKVLVPNGVWLAMKGKLPTEELSALDRNAIQVFHVEQIQVPGLDADRCIVWMRKKMA